MRLFNPDSTCDFSAQEEDEDFLVGYCIFKPAVLQALCGEIFFKLIHCLLDRILRSMKTANLPKERLFLEKQACFYLFSMVSALEHR